MTQTKPTVTEKKSDLVHGIFEMADKGHAFLRDVKRHFRVGPADPYINQDFVRRAALREGMEIEARTKGKRGNNPNVVELLSVNGEKPDVCIEWPALENFTVIDPTEMIHLETGPEPMGPRVIDLLTPIGKGTRGLLVAPPRTGKTILLQQIADGIHANHPEIHLMVLLIDERPEEVTDMRRKIHGEVIASSNDKGIDSHVRTARLGLERVKRLVEQGRDVVVLLDSITRLGRAFNAWTKHSGRIMSGGIDARALELPKRIFGAARNTEEAGSLTIIATALIDTGSRMDEVIFQEFKGTGNMELVLDRQLANRRVWPAIDIAQSGTRKEELLLGRETVDRVARLRRHLDNLPVGQDTESLIRALKKHKSNADFLAQLP